MSKTISPELFMAILSMDAYNRNYNAAFEVGGVSIGNATIIKDSEDVFKDPNAPKDALSPAGKAGFYAVAYDWNGQTVISYRGTDGGLFGKIKELTLTVLPSCFRATF